MRKLLKKQGVTPVSIVTDRLGSYRSALRRARPSSSQPAGNDGAEFHSPTADRLVGHVDTSLGEHILDVAVAHERSGNRARWPAG